MSEKKLIKILQLYAEIGSSRKIAKKIIERRNENKMNTTLDLKNAISDATNGCSNKILSRVFQAIRICVNQEIETFKKTLAVTPEYLIEGGRILVISFHSIEDRITKHFFKDSIIKDEYDYYRKDIVNKDLKLKVLTKKPIMASDKELSLNKRSRSAKLRVSEL